MSWLSKFGRAAAAGVQGFAQGFDRGLDRSLQRQANERAERGMEMQEQAFLRNHTEQAWAPIANAFEQGGADLDALDQIQELIDSTRAQITDPNEAQYFENQAAAVRQRATLEAQKHLGKAVARVQNLLPGDVTTGAGTTASLGQVRQALEEARALETLYGQRQEPEILEPLGQLRQGIQGLDQKTAGYAALSSLFSRLNPMASDTEQTAVYNEMGQVMAGLGIGGEEIPKYIESISNSQRAAADNFFIDTMIPSADDPDLLRSYMIEHKVSPMAAQLGELRIARLNRERSLQVTPEQQMAREQADRLYRLLPFAIAEQDTDSYNAMVDQIRDAWRFSGDTRSADWLDVNRGSVQTALAPKTRVEYMNWLHMQDEDTLASIARTHHIDIPLESTELLPAEIFSMIDKARFGTPMPEGSFDAEAEASRLIGWVTGGEQQKATDALQRLDSWSALHVRELVQATAAQGWELDPEIGTLQRVGAGGWKGLLGNRAQAGGQGAAGLWRPSGIPKMPRGGALGATIGSNLQQMIGLDQAAPAPADTTQPTLQR